MKYTATVYSALNIQTGPVAKKSTILMQHFFPKHNDNQEKNTAGSQMLALFLAYQIQWHHIICPSNFRVYKKNKHFHSYNRVLAATSFEERETS